MAPVDAALQELLRNDTERSTLALSTVQKIVNNILSHQDGLLSWFSNILSLGTSLQDLWDPMKGFGMPSLWMSWCLHATTRIADAR